MPSGPIQDALAFLKGSGREVNNDEVRRVAKMLSLTDAELVMLGTLARSLARSKPNPLPRPQTPTTHDTAFMEWCESYKPCKRCKRKFYGPVCECEVGS